MEINTELLIVGAGPFGLSMAAYAKYLGIEHVVVGKPMGFWQDHMPGCMYLRSARDWHLDPLNVHTIERLQETKGGNASEFEPLSLRFYLEYAEWFQREKKLDVIPVLIQRLDRVDSGGVSFRAVLEDGRSIRALRVVVPLGFQYFRHEPRELTELLVSGRYSHTCDLVDFERLSGKRCLIIGGRQSAFEWAALLAEAGADEVHVSHRHPSPAFAASDWSWANALVDAMIDNPGWFRHLSESEKDAVSMRLWAEGRLKVEPWLEPRVMRPGIHLWPKTQVTGSRESHDGELLVKLSNGRTLAVDHVILATGYKVKMDRVPFLARGNILESLRTRNEFPVLDEHFQTNLPGLFITSMAACQDFGPFFAFTIAVRTSAIVIGNELNELRHKSRLDPK